MSGWLVDMYYVAFRFRCTCPFRSADVDITQPMRLNIVIFSCGVGRSHEIFMSPFRRQNRCPDSSRPLHLYRAVLPLHCSRFTAAVALNAS